MFLCEKTGLRQRKKSSPYVSGCFWSRGTRKPPFGTFNEEYCKWCYTDGEFKYSSKEQLIDFCVEHMANENWPAEQVRAHMEAVIPKLNHWK